MDQGTEELVQAIRDLFHDRIDTNIASDQFSSHLADILVEYREAPFTVPRELLLPEEFERRREIGLRIQDRLLKHDSNFKVRMFHVAAIAVVPLPTLMYPGKLCPDFRDGVAVNDAVDLIMEFERMRHFANLFVQKLGKPAERQYDQYQSSIHGDQGASSSAFESGQGQKEQTSVEERIQKRKIARSPSQKRKCKERDGNACVITGMADPDVCHIFPFALNETVDNTNRTKKFFAATEALVSADFRRTYTPLMANASNLGGSDKAWNLICLNKTLHDWWGRAYWGFQYHGIEAVTEPGDGSKKKVRVTLIFRWLPRFIAMREREPDDVTLAGDSNSLDALNGELQRFFQDESYYPTEIPRKPGHVEFRLHTGETLKSGQKFHFIMDTGDAPDFRHVVELQWASLCLFIMKGGAEVDSFSADDDSDDGADDRGQFGVKQKMPSPEQLSGETGKKGPDALSPPRAHAAIWQETPADPADLQSKSSSPLMTRPTIPDLQIRPRRQAEGRFGASLQSQQDASAAESDFYQFASGRRSLRDSLRGSMREMREKTSAGLRGARENLEARPSVRRLQDLFQSNRSSPQSPGKEQKEGKGASATPSENVNPFQEGSPVQVEGRRSLVPLGVLAERVDPNVRGEQGQE
ncbi:uncharacterized protein FSUBG_4679 [Fusarium subglutinans]|uniref:HNH nuclease domain-containing protein n=1 Tax=Gibberella subglutinans TaxID=42677 RepID=A0A8H5V2T0_GIBSU|nr:uncharacterized protein FSUBG_4679 [Fusarium subglutinans]KAF5608461.1 hypothetical protein FSUBG_4679 [Fusarium subglutinans]